jgi:hypothetical protein
MNFGIDYLPFYLLKLTTEALQPHEAATLGW